MAGTTPTPTLVAQPAFRLDPEVLRRAVLAAPAQQLVVATQSPAAGTPVLRGSTVEVTVIDLGVISISTIHPDLPVSMQNLSLADTITLMATPAVAAVVNDPAAKPDAAATAIKDTGLVSTVSPTDARIALSALSTIGIRRL